MTFIIIAAAVIILIAVLMYIAASYMFKKICSRVDSSDGLEEATYKRIAESPLADRAYYLRGERAFAASLTYEDRWIKSRDGLSLHARYYLPSGVELDADFCERHPKKRVIILAHGFQGSGIHDFGCAMRFYLSLGFEILMIDQRAHGQSGGKYICFGAKEQYDLVDWCNYIDRENDGRADILISGISMGATTAMLAGTSPEIAPALRGVIADCGYSDVYGEFCHVAKNGMHLYPHPLLEVMELICKRRAGFGFRDFSTVEALKKSKVPFLFVHGDDDDFVLPDNTRRNFAALRKPEWGKNICVTVPKSGHGLAYLGDTEGCQQTIKEFFENALS